MGGKIFFLAVIPVALLLTLLASGCVQQGAPGDAGSSSADATPKTASIIIKNMSFEPAELTIKTGTKVTWFNEDSVAHIIQAETIPGQEAVTFRSGNLLTGDKYSFTFNETGTFGYNCRIHRSMKGRITVEE